MTQIIRISRIDPRTGWELPAGFSGKKGTIISSCLHCERSSVLLDPLQPAPKGSEIDVYYDVCELPDDAKFSATLDITRNQSGIRKLFGGSGVESVRREFGMAPGSPKERRHEEVELGSLPVGSYTVRVTITDDKGRTRARSVPLDITGQ